MKTISNHFKYASNVWLTSAILTPCFFGLLMVFDEGISTDIPLTILFFTFFGMLLSIPNYYLLFFFVWRINQTNLEIFKKRIAINLLAIFLTFSLFALIFQGDIEDAYFSYILPSAYSATLTFGIWFFNLYRIDPEEVLGKEYLSKVRMLDDILDDEIY